MQKDSLVKLLAECDGAYPRFLQKAKEKTKSQKWGTGVGVPWSLEPYRMEMLGIKPGRMLKGESEPGPRRYCYSYDDEGRVIHVVKYGKLIGPADNRDWIRSDEFYEYFDGFVMRYVYDDTFREDPGSEITRIVKFAIVDDKNSVAYQIEKDDLEYTETIYSRAATGGIKNITVHWPEGPFPDRVLEVVGEGAELEIFEIRDRVKLPVYPES
ncbi:Uncharacterised protein [Burkholderia cepacia]|uniref:Uncharacterized protein n=1 Tax=Burkholderia cepacia TaxID=292 RepID=A0AAE8NAV7_BURCE|nr:hypothetical protein [Burkholderia cepacia]POM17557.1 hypothetical protein CSX04_05855 [Burkholderia cepacia]SPV16028.1 Uncharacterised protein [Burkholderia cepacia]